MEPVRGALWRPAHVMAQTRAKDQAATSTPVRPKFDQVAMTPRVAVAATEMTAGLRESVKESALSRHVLGRFNTPEQAAAFILFLQEVQ